jgi:8-oxo-dGTP diphosphatase
VAKSEPKPVTESRAPSGKAEAYGGVIFDDNDRVLLREPANHHGGYVWTFPKGRPKRGEAAEEAAIREAREESGVPVEIVARIPGEFEGDTTVNFYFLMSPCGLAGEPDAETARVIWVTPEEAKAYIAETRSVRGRERDLAVLAAARRARSLRK